MFLISDAMLGFVMDRYSVHEDTGEVSVCVDSGMTEGFQTDLTVTLSAMDGTACMQSNVHALF